jgi:hypothetical protein
MKRLSSASGNSVVKDQHIWLRKRYCGTSDVWFRFEGSTDWGIGAIFAVR